MTDSADPSTHSETARNANGSRPSRRAYLAATGGLGAGLASGPIRAGRSVLRTDRVPPRPNTQQRAREDFLWLGASLWRDAAIRRNLYAFARRHDLAVVLVKGSSATDSLGEPFQSALTAAAECDLTVWLNVGLLSEITAERLATDQSAREGHLEWLRTVARRHDELFDGGRVVLWQEAPVMGQWVEGGAWTRAAVENLRAYGPAIFDVQKGAIEAVNDALDVGCFVHFPYIVDSKQPRVFQDLADGFRDRGVVPDFAFVDFYRGWYEKDVGPGPANAAVRSLVSNARRALGDRPVYYLGQSHTINPRHTPSKQAMRMNLRTSLDAGASGVGWYVRNRYVPTEVGFDPFVPNVAQADVEDESVNTFTVARDRFLYPWLATLQASRGFDAADAFDLWLVGDGFGHYDHRLSVRTGGGRWEYVGDFGGYVTGNFERVGDDTTDGASTDGGPAVPEDGTASPEGEGTESAVTDRATIYRALDRERFLGGSELECRVETSDRASAADLHSIFVVPCEPDAYISEADAARLVAAERSIERFSLGTAHVATGLTPGETHRFTVPVSASSAPSLSGLRHPEYVEVIRQLARFEAREGVDPSGYFDLWLVGDGLERPAALPAIVGRDGAARPLRKLAIVASTSSTAICHGLPREPYLGENGLELALDADAPIAAAYAMPYAGSATYRSPAHASALLVRQSAAVKTFSIDHVSAPSDDRRTRG